MAKGIVIRNKQEELAVKVLQAAHEFLNQVLEVDTELVFQRECNWGKNAFHAGWYRNSEKKVALNFRNMYGATIQDLLEVLAHEMRHAQQYENGYLLDKGRTGKARARTSIIRGTWLGEPMVVKYEDAPWEIDARKAEKPYSEWVIEELEIPEKVLSTRLPMGTSTKSDKNATYKMLQEKYGLLELNLLATSWLKKKPKESGYTYVLKSDLPKGFSFKKREDSQWLYDNQQLIKFQPYIKVTEEYGGFSVRQMVS